MIVDRGRFPCRALFLFFPVSQTREWYPTTMEEHCQLLRSVQFPPVLHQTAKRLLGPYHESTVHNSTMLLVSNETAADVEIGEISHPDLPSSHSTSPLNKDEDEKDTHLDSLPPPQPQDVTSDELSGKRYFQETATGTFRPISFRNHRFGQSVIYRPNADAMTTKFFRWAFRSSFLVLIVVAQGSFFVWTCIFALLHAWNVYSQPNCVSPPFDPRTEPFKDMFRDCWQLSWTTFATVGFGIISPSVVGSSFYSNNNTPIEAIRLFRMDSYCFAQSFLCSIEAFVGILFAGFWTAVLFSKVAKVNNKALVSFSSQLVVQYGIALSSKHNPPKHKGAPSTFPCPILEFRIVNKQHSQKGGGIINASVNVVASLRKEQLREHVKQKSSIRQFTSLLLSMNRKKSISSPSHPHQSSVYGMHPSSNHRSSVLPQSTDYHRTHSSPTLMHLKNSTPESSFEDLSLNNPRFNESSQPRTAGAFVFTPLTVEPGNFPLFQNVWTIRHVLDEKSPLLKPKIRTAIKDHQGSWTADMCSNPQAVQNCIQFEKILVSFSGTSQLNASSVYSQKVYSSEDLFVGYDFENMLIIKPFGNVGVDEGKVSMIREQSHKIKGHEHGSGTLLKTHTE